MKSNHSKTNLRALLDDVLPEDGAASGPSRAEVKALLRKEGRRRRKRHLGIATVLLLTAALAGSLRWRRDTDTDRVTAIPQNSSSSIAIKEVDDQQLMALLEDTPAALMEWPNGERTLLLVYR